jgi:hypothetical protein
VATLIEFQLHGYRSVPASFYPFHDLEKPGIRVISAVKTNMSASCYKFAVYIYKLILKTISTDNSLLQSPDFLWLVTGSLRG